MVGRNLCSKRNKFLKGNTKIKSYLLIIFLYLCAYTYAAPQIGTTTLLYGESNASDVLLSQLDEAKIKDPKAKLGLKRAVLSEVVGQMSGFQVLLNSVLTESEAFVVFDANDIVNNWKKTNLKLLNTFYKTTSIQAPINESGSKGSRESSTVSTSNTKFNNSPRFVLLGWVDSIHERESKTPIASTGKSALIYSLEIRCEYRLINPDTNRVVAAFIAVGHGGVAKIIGAGSPPVNYVGAQITSDMFFSLAQDLRHILRVREDEYIKKKINAKKINVSMPVSAK